MDKASEQYNRLLEYVKNTHASTHNMYDLHVEEVIVSWTLRNLNEWAEI